MVTKLFFSVSSYNGVNNLSVYPNPATNYINLSIKPNNNLSPNLSALAALNLTPGLINNQKSPLSYNIKIINITGSIIKNVVSSSVNWRDNVSALMPGTYIIQVTNASDNSLVGKSTFIKL
jgi:hypothetical protein